MNDTEKYEAIEDFFNRPEGIRAFLMSDGGNIELDLVKGNEVIISFQGACGSCPSSSGGTLRGIEKALRAEFGEDIVVIPTNAYRPDNPRPIQI
tara:strand:+ start:28 stop:309 length:282 start_codon:yes stop_codon:yes gene_type:complete